MKRFVLPISMLALMLTRAAYAPTPSLELETKIPLGKVNGRIDHFAVDLGRQRLFVAELGNDSVGVIDLKERKLLRRLTGFKNPQGIAYELSTDLVFVANAGDGSVRLFQSVDLAPAGRIDLGDDADNIRVDARAKRVFVGYGSGAIAVIDPVRRTKVGAILLKAHPESFQLDPDSTRIFANVPDAKQIAVVDRDARTQSATWTFGNARANFPMTIDAEQKRVLVVFRKPARLVAFDATAGAVVADVTACADSDDVFVDTKRHRVYISCGEGFIDVFEPRDTSYQRIGRIASVPGARTSLFVPELDRLFLAVRATAAEPAAVWVFKPAP
jgi:DNA-binding beta-propeller fold protein YncE